VLLWSAEKWQNVLMRTFLKRRLPVIAVLAVLLTGGAVAAWASGGSPGHRHGPGHQHAAGPLRGARLLQAAATYIGVPVETLQQELRSGKSLVQVATEHGKGEAGLVQALATVAREGLEQRLALAVRQPGGLRGGGHARGQRLKAAAAQYLGTTPEELAAKLRTGTTLAQIADSTAGHSREGLIGALMATRQPKAANPLAAGPRAGNLAHSERLLQRITAFVDRSHTPRAAKRERKRAVVG